MNKFKSNKLTSVFQGFDVELLPTTFKNALYAEDENILELEDRIKLTNDDEPRKELSSYTIEVPVQLSEDERYIKVGLDVFKIDKFSIIGRSDRLIRFPKVKQFDLLSFSLNGVTKEVDDADVYEWIDTNNATIHTIRDSVCDNYRYTVFVAVSGDRLIAYNIKDSLNDELTTSIKEDSLLDILSNISTDSSKIKESIDKFNIEGLKTHDHVRSEPAIEIVMSEDIRLQLVRLGVIVPNVYEWICENDATIYELGVDNSSSKYYWNVIYIAVSGDKFIAYSLSDTMFDCYDGRVQSFCRVFFLAAIDKIDKSTEGIFVRELIDRAKDVYDYNTVEGLKRDDVLDETAIEMELDAEMVEVLESKGLKL